MDAAEAQLSVLPSSAADDIGHAPVHMLHAFTSSAVPLTLDCPPSSSSSSALPLATAEPVSGAVWGGSSVGDTSAASAGGSGSSGVVSVNESGESKQSVGGSGGSIACIPGKSADLEMQDDGGDDEGVVQRAEDEEEEEAAVLLLLQQQQEEEMRRRRLEMAKLMEAQPVTHADAEFRTALQELIQDHLATCMELAGCNDDSDDDDGGGESNNDGRGEESDDDSSSSVGRDAGVADASHPDENGESDGRDESDGAVNGDSSEGDESVTGDAVGGAPQPDGDGDDNLLYGLAGHGPELGEAYLPDSSSSSSSSSRGGIGDGGCFTSSIDEEHPNMHHEGGYDSRPPPQGEAVEDEEMAEGGGAAEVMAAASTEWSRADAAQSQPVQEDMEAARTVLAAEEGESRGSVLTGNEGLVAAAAPAAAAAGPVGSLVEASGVAPTVLSVSATDVAGVFGPGLGPGGTPPGEADSQAIAPFSLGLVSGAEVVGNGIPTEAEGDRLAEGGQQHRASPGGERSGDLLQQLVLQQGLEHPGLAMEESRGHLLEGQLQWQQGQEQEQQRQQHQLRDLEGFGQRGALASPPEESTSLASGFSTQTNSAASNSSDGASITVGDALGSSGDGVGVGVDTSAADGLRGGGAELSSSSSGGGGGSGRNGGGGSSGGTGVVDRAATILRQLEHERRTELQSLHSARAVSHFSHRRQILSYMQRRFAGGDNDNEEDEDGASGGRQDAGARGSGVEGGRMSGELSQLQELRHVSGIGSEFRSELEMIISLGPAPPGEPLRSRRGMLIGMPHTQQQQQQQGDQLRQPQRRIATGAMGHQQQQQQQQQHMGQERHGAGVRTPRSSRSGTPYASPSTSLTPSPSNSSVPSPSGQAASPAPFHSPRAAVTRTPVGAAAAGGGGGAPAAVAAALAAAPSPLPPPPHRGGRIAPGVRMYQQRIAAAAAAATTTAATAAATAIAGGGGRLGRRRLVPPPLFAARGGAAAEHADGELQELLSRRSVTTTLASEFRERLELLIDSLITHRSRFAAAGPAGLMMAPMHLPPPRNRRNVNAPRDGEAPPPPPPPPPPPAGQGRPSAAGAAAAAAAEAEERAGAGGQDGAAGGADTRLWRPQPPPPPPPPSAASWREWQQQQQQQQLQQQQQQQQQQPGWHQWRMLQQQQLRNSVEVQEAVRAEVRVVEERVAARMSRMEQMVEVCVTMLGELQRSQRQELAGALQRMYSGGQGVPEEALGGSRWSLVHAGTCCVCCDRSINCLLYRCGHMCTCVECGDELKQRDKSCPMCRAPIAEVVRAYTVLP